MSFWGFDRKRVSKRSVCFKIASWLLSLSSKLSSTAFWFFCLVVAGRCLVSRCRGAILFSIATPRTLSVAPKAEIYTLIATLLLAPLFRATLFLLWSGGATAIYVWMPCRADSLAIGVLAALLWREGKLEAWYAAHHTQFYVLLAILALAMPFFTKWLFSPYAFWMGFIGYSWFALFFVCLLLLGLLEPHGTWSRFLSLAFLREMGRLSYCIYLIHLLILGLCHSLILHKLPSIASIPSAAVTLLAFCITYLLAALSWRYVERPLLRRGHLYRYEFRRSEA